MELDPLRHDSQDRRPNVPAGALIPHLFLLLNGAIAKAHANGDDRTVDLLLAAKMGAVRRHHALLEEGR